MGVWGGGPTAHTRPAQTAQRPCHLTPQAFWKTYIPGLRSAPLEGSSQGPLLSFLTKLSLHWGSLFPPYVGGL